MLKSGACWLWVLLVGATVPGCNGPIRNVSYVPGSSDSLNALDIYRPGSGGRHPVIIFIHGGSYTQGDKRSEVGAKPETFTRKGFVFVSINYRLSPAVRHPVHIQDVARAVAWVHANIRRYGGDSTRLYVMGHSSGANLAALIATAEQFLQAEGLDLRALSGAILLDGTGYDVPRRFAADSNEARRLRKILGDDPEVWREASALYHVEKGKGIPPFLIVHLATRVPSTLQSQALAAALTAAETRVEVKPVSANHYRLNLDLGLEKNPASAAVFAFVRSVDDSRVALGAGVRPPDRSPTQ